MPRNRSEKLPKLPESIDPLFMPVIVADCHAHFREGRNSKWICSASPSNLGHSDGQEQFDELSQELKRAWDKPPIRAYMARYLEYLYATQP